MRSPTCTTAWTRRSVDAPDGGGMLGWRRVYEEVLGYVVLERRDAWCCKRHVHIYVAAAQFGVRIEQSKTLVGSSHLLTRRQCCQLSSST